MRVIQILALVTFFDISLANFTAGMITMIKDKLQSPMQVYPGTNWETRLPEEVGLSPAKLNALRDLIGGRGCVVRHGYMVYTWGEVSKSADVASAVKPVISTLLLFAIQEGKLKSVDDKVADFEPRLEALNNGKDARITWRHLASQTSGYGLSELPGKAWAYNDYALALYYDVLMEKVFRENGTNVLKTRLGDMLGFQDPYTFEAFGPNDRPGRLAISVRDFARFGLFYLREGRWKDKQVLRKDLVQLALNSPVPPAMPRTKGLEAETLPGQRTLGGAKDQTPIGPGYYSFNWWLNRTDKADRRLFVDAPPDTYVASGHSGRRMLWVVPSLDLIVSWNDANVEDHEASPGNSNAKCNQAARLMKEAVIAESQRRNKATRQTQVSIVKSKWHINGKVTYCGARAEGLLMNVRMVNAVFEDLKRPDFDPDINTSEFIAEIPNYVSHGIRAFTICLQGGFPGYEGAVNSAFNADGSLRESYLKRVRRVIEACDRQGVVLILGCYYQRQDQMLRDEKAVRAGVVKVAKWIQENRFTNVVLEIANEFGHPGFDHRLLKTAEGIVQLIHLAKQTAPGLLVSASGLGDGTLPNSVAQASDFLLVHFNGVPVDQIPARIAALKKFGKPIVCNEDDKVGEQGAEAAEACVANRTSWGFMAYEVNQRFPFTFKGAKDNPIVYAKLKEVTKAMGSSSGIKWLHLSNKTSDLPVPPGSDQQTLCLILDADKDGKNEFVICCRGKEPALVWHRRGQKGWMTYLVETEAIPIGAGGALCGIDGDGDLDIVAGEDYQGNKVY